MTDSIGTELQKRINQLLDAQVKVVDSKHLQELPIVRLTLSATWQKWRALCQP
jgi:hypothetical protein